MTSRASVGKYDAILELVRSATLANDSSIWLPSDDGLELVMKFHTGTVLGKGDTMKQPLSEGVVSEAYKTGRVVEDTGMFRVKMASGLVDRALEQRTVAMIAAPVFHAGKVAGVLSVVQVVTHDAKPESWGLSPGSAQLVELAAGVIEGLMVEGW